MIESLELYISSSAKVYKLTDYWIKYVSVVYLLCMGMVVNQQEFSIKADFMIETSVACHFGVSPWRMYTSS